MCAYYHPRVSHRHNLRRIAKDLRNRLKPCARYPPTDTSVRTDPASELNRCAVSASSTFPFANVAWSEAPLKHWIRLSSQRPIQIFKEPSHDTITATHDRRHVHSPFREHHATQLHPLCRRVRQILQPQPPRVGSGVRPPIPALSDPGA